MWPAIVAAVALAVILYEFRLRRPDQLILYESKGTIGFRKARWYPRHFSLAVPGTTHLMEPRVEVTARGSIPVTVKLAVTVAASRDAIPSLIRAGGWDSHAVERATNELDALLQGHIKEATEKFVIEELSSEAVRSYLTQRLPPAAKGLGLEIVALTVQSIDPVDPAIADAMRQRESARILEQTESLNQKARVSAAQAKILADDQIARLEHELELKKADLRAAELEKESALARRRVEDDVERSRLRLQFDREEMELLKENPQLLLLTPQVARLAEASQSLRNARTVVSLTPTDADQGSSLLAMFQTLLQNMVQGSARGPEKKQKSS